MRKRYAVELTEDERGYLKGLIAAGTAPARKLTHARILLKADQAPGGPAWVDDAIAEAVEVSQPTVFRVRRQYVEQGLDAALHRRPPTRRLRAQAERRAGGAPGGARLQRAAGRPGPLVAAPAGGPAGGAGDRRGGLVPDRAPRAQKNELKPWLKQQWCIPPHANGEFVWRMEDVLDVYTRPYDPRRPLVCMDEASKQLLRDARAPLPPAPGQPARVDYEYERKGVVNLFLFCEPLEGRRWVAVTERRTRVDWAHLIQELVDVRYPDAERIVLVMDNLNTHTPASLYEAFPPAEAQRLADKLEIHYTPKHGSWLNIAEIELSVLGRQCLDRRVPDPAILGAEVAAWQAGATPAAARSTGASPPPTPASSSSASTHHRRSNGVLGRHRCTAVRASSTRGGVVPNPVVRASPGDRQGRRSRHETVPALGGCRRSLSSPQRRPHPTRALGGRGRDTPTSPSASLGDGSKTEDVASSPTPAGPKSRPRSSSAVEVRLGGAHRCR